MYHARILAFFRNADAPVLVAFWLFGLINNVLYVIILSAAQDLVGHVPKGIVLLADVMPSFFTKLVAPYFIHRVPYGFRVVAFAVLSSAGMLLVALTPPSRSVPVKLAGVVLASLSSGGGELSFLGLTHFYGPLSLAAWGSGTGGAGLVGAGLYVVMTNWLGFSSRATLLTSALLPIVMLVSFFAVLPRDALDAEGGKVYERVPAQDEEVSSTAEDTGLMVATSSILVPTPRLAVYDNNNSDNGWASFTSHLRQAKALFLPYMMPLLLVYVAEYIINMGVSPTLLFPLKQSPFTEFRSFYPFYGFLYQLGVFISRSSTPFLRIHNIYVPSLLQVANLVLLTLHAMFDFLPSVYIVFMVVFWEGLLGGAVYVNTFAEIMDKVPTDEREFSLSATSVSDSAGICLAGFASMLVEVWLCDWQVGHGRDYCRRIEPSITD